MAIIKKQELASIGEDMEKGEPLYIVSGHVNGYSHNGKQYGIPSQN